MQVYLDNAATTQLDSAVISAMTQYSNNYYGNPSSTHLKGREARNKIENARSKIAGLVGADAKEIIFTSGGTEANNTILQSLVLNKKIKRIISSPIEHFSILDTLDWLSKTTNVTVVYLNIDKNGNLDINQLEKLLQLDISTLVSLMHANNEIGKILALKEVGDLCIKYNALFHSDMVQTLAHYPIILKELPIDFATASAHKAHGPKGVGFIYNRSGSVRINTLLHGGLQERGKRGGTENAVGIIGMAKAYEISIQSLKEDKEHILSLKHRMIEMIREKIPQITFNGNSHKDSTCLYNLLNVQIPGPIDETFFFKLDIDGIYASEGSACSSGSSKGSHVLRAISKNSDEITTNLRISFCKKNTGEEVDYAIGVIAKILNIN